MVKLDITRVYETRISGSNPDRPTTRNIGKISMNKKQEATERLLQALPYFRHAVSEAQAEGKVQFGILCIKSDGSGSIKAQFDASDFFEDIALILDAPPQTEDDTLNVKADQILQQLGLK